MTNLKQIVLIPHWIADGLKRKNMVMADCLDFVKIKDIFSLNDLAGFIALEHFSDVIFGIEAPVPATGLHIGMRIPEGYPEAKKLFWDTVCKIADDASTRTEIKERLFTLESKQERYEKSFYTYDLTQDTLGIVISPGFFVGDAMKNEQLLLVESILRTLYVYHTLPDVSSSPIFRRYLELIKP